MPTPNNPGGAQVTPLPDPNASPGVDGNQLGQQTGYGTPAPLVPPNDGTPVTSMPRDTVNPKQ
jgi:hypothetical protein